jgi:hypothetical protein
MKRAQAAFIVTVYPWPKYSFPVCKMETISVYAYRFFLMRISWPKAYYNNSCTVSLFSMWQLLQILFLWFLHRLQNRGGPVLVSNSLRLVILRGIWWDPCYWQHFDFSFACFPLPPPLLPSCWTQRLCSGTMPFMGVGHIKRFGFWTYSLPFCFISTSNSLALPLFVLCQASIANICFTPNPPFKPRCLLTPRFMKPHIR